MEINNRFKLPAAAWLLALTMLLPACVADVYGPGPYTQPQNPAYYYDYSYYPNSGVYFNYYSGYYYYRSNNARMRVRTLPPHVYLGSRVALRIKSDRPYTYYNVHRQRYRPSPGYHPDPTRDRRERSYNRDHHEQYLKRYRR